METRDIRDLDVAVLEAQVAEFYRAEVAHRQEIQRLTQERDEAAASAHRVYEQYSFVCERLEQAEAERDALAAHVATLREALTEALNEWAHASGYKGEYLASKHGDAERIAELRALAATEGGNHE